jgi:hypothetical protein
VMTSNLSRRIVPGETVIFAGAGLGRCPGLNHERLETNTSMPHIMRATSYGPGEPRVRIPVKRFLACPFTFTDNPNHAGVSAPPAMWNCDCGTPAAVPSRTIESLFIDLFS